MKKIVVASLNPVKIASAKAGFTRMFPDESFKAVGVSAGSEVSDQPMSEEETLTGAENRVKNAAKIEPEADFWVGMEGGLETTAGGMESFAWIVVKSKSGVVGKSRTCSFTLPEAMAKLISQGKELGEADDIVFGQTNSKQINGTIGNLTGNVITRTSYYESAVILALIPFKNPQLY